MVFEGNVNDPLTTTYCTLFCQSVVLSSQLWNSMTCHLTHMEVARECLSLIFEWRELRLGLESSVATYFLPLCHCVRYSVCYASRDHTISFSEPVNCCLNNWAHWVFSFLRFCPNSQFLSVVCCSFSKLSALLSSFFLIFIPLSFSFFHFLLFLSFSPFILYLFNLRVCMHQRSYKGLCVQFTCGMRISLYSVCPDGDTEGVTFAWRVHHGVNKKTPQLLPIVCWTCFRQPVFSHRSARRLAGS